MPDTPELPSFIIPVGTQVVLRSDKPVPGTDEVKPAGSVARVLEAPTTHARAYKIRFIDGTELRDLRGAFLSRHIYKTYSGYVLSQFKLMERGLQQKGTYKPKHAMHLVRLLLSGINALTTGDVRVDVGEWRAELLEIRCGAWP